MLEPQKSEAEESRGTGLGTAIYVGILVGVVLTVLLVSWGV